MAETQESISAWAEETFGAAGSLARVAARANEEMAELLRAITAGAPAGDVLGEAADVAIVLERVAASGNLGDPRGRGRQLDLTDELANPADPLSLAAFANLHLAMFLDAVADLYPDSVQRGALGMVSAGLFRLAEALGGDLDRAIDAKMAINRTRSWSRDGSGHGYHERTG